MKTLSNSAVKAFDKHSTEVSSKFDELTKAIVAFNQELVELYQPVTEALKAYNLAIVDANEFRSGITDTQINYMEARSDKWKESDEGTSYSQWSDQWSQELDQVSIDDPTSLEEPADEAADILSELTFEP